MEEEKEPVIPKKILQEIKSYIEKGEPMNDFLMAVFSDSLCSSIANADNTNVHLLPTLVKYLFHNCPLESHGNLEKVYEYMKKKQKELKNDQKHIL